MVKVLELWGNIPIFEWDLVGPPGSEVDKANQQNTYRASRHLGGLYPGSWAKVEHTNQINRKLKSRHRIKTWKSGDLWAWSSPSVQPESWYLISSDILESLCKFRIPILEFINFFQDHCRSLLQVTGNIGLHVAKRWTNGCRGDHQLIIKIWSPWSFPIHGATLKSSIFIGSSIITCPFWRSHIYGKPHMIHMCSTIRFTCEPRRFLG